MKTYQCQSCGEMVERRSINPFLQFYCETNKVMSYLSLVPYTRIKEAIKNPPKPIKRVKKKPALGRKTKKEK